MLPLLLEFHKQNIRPSDKSKPIARWGRKATGPKSGGDFGHLEIAGLPKWLFFKTHLLLSGEDGFSFFGGRDLVVANRAMRTLIRRMGMFFLFVFLFPVTPISDGEQLAQDHLASSAVSASGLLNGRAQRPEEDKGRTLLKIPAILKKFKTGLSEKVQSQLAKTIYQESLKYNYDPELILALVIKESSFYNWSESRMGALGLMQILTTTGREVARAKNIPWHGRKTLLDPNLNIELGTHYLATLHARFGKM